MQRELRQYTATAPCNCAVVVMADIQGAFQQTLLQVAQQVEQQIDSELHKLDNLQEDDLDSIRQQRLKELRLRQAKKTEWLAKGHGEYKEIQSEKEFFDEMKGEERMVCHFFRENWPCKVIDKHLQILAKGHLETKFVKLNAEKAPFLTERLKIWMLPTLALIKYEKTVDYVVGFDDLGGKDDFTTDMLAERLARVDVLIFDAPVRTDVAAEKRSIRSGSQHRTASDEDSDFDD